MSKPLYYWPVRDEKGNEGTVVACSVACAAEAAEANDLTLAGDWVDYANHPLDQCEGSCE